MYTVFGAGSIGTVLATLLADADVDVRIAGRGAVEELCAEGDDETIRARVPVVDEPVGTILLCTHADQVETLAARFAGREIVTFQNGVAAETAAAKHCDVIGGVWRMTCTLVRPGFARFTNRGRIVVGRHPNGMDISVAQLAADLRTAGFRVGVSTDIAADKWLKLFVTLGSGANALIRSKDHALPEFGELKALLLEEAKRVFEEAGIVARSCDGEDASLDEVIAKQRRGGPRARPVHNAAWRRLSRGLPIVERHHATVAELGDAPRNALMAKLLDEAEGPESLGARDVLSRLRGT